MTAVLLVDLSRRYGGADVRVIQLANALPESGVRVAVAVLGSFPAKGPLTEAGCEIHEVGTAKWDPRIALRLWNLVRAGAFTVVDSHNPQSQFWTRAALLGVRGVTRVATVHSVYRDEHAGRRRGRMYERLLRGERHLVAVSESVGQHLSETLGLGPTVSVIPNAIVPSQDQMTGNEPSALLAHLGWVDRDVVICLGRLAPVKGQEHLLGAVALLRDRWPDLRCLLVGSGPDESRLRGISDQLGIGEIVHFAGFREDGAALLSHAEMLVQPSLTEGMPFAVLESMAAGTPVVASAVGGLRSLGDGVEARLVIEADPDALAEAMHELHTDPGLRESLAAGGRERLRREHDLSHMIGDTLVAYGVAAP